MRKGFMIISCLADILLRTHSSLQSSALGFIRVPLSSG